mgnify:CR=1 FL=1
MKFTEPPQTTAKAKLVAMRQQLGGQDPIQMVLKDRDQLWREEESRLILECEKLDELIKTQSEPPKPALGSESTNCIPVAK